MDVVTAEEIQEHLKSSTIYDRYAKHIDRESAYEILTQKLEGARKQEEAQLEDENEDKAKGKEEKSMVEKMVNSSVGRTVVRELTRGLLGVLGLKSTSRRKTGWF
jgi:hypothetical protein